MSARHVWLGLSLMLGLVWGRVEAQTPQVPQPQIIYVEQVPVQAVPLEAMPVEAMPAMGAPAAAPVRGIRVASWPLFGGQDGSKRDALNRRGYWCDSHLDSYGCQNWRTQCQFVFGSCRSFFGEPCRPAAPLFHNLRGGAGGGDCNR